MAVVDETKGEQDFGERALDLLREKLGNRRLDCQLCGKNNWQIQGKPAFVFIVAPDLGHNSFLHGGNQDGLPFVVMACKTCGNTLFINSMILELHHPSNLDKNNPPTHD